MRQSWSLMKRPPRSTHGQRRWSKRGWIAWWQDGPSLSSPTVFQPSSTRMWSWSWTRDASSSEATTLPWWQNAELITASTPVALKLINTKKSELVSDFLLMDNVVFETFLRWDRTSANFEEVPCLSFEPKVSKLPCDAGTKVLASQLSLDYRARRSGWVGSTTLISSAFTALLNCAEVGRRNRILTNYRFLSHSLICCGWRERGHILYDSSFRAYFNWSVISFESKRPRR